MNVLSLFDGMSCGQIALTNLGCFPQQILRVRGGQVRHTADAPRVPRHDTYR